MALDRVHLLADLSSLKHRELLDIRGNLFVYCAWNMEDRLGHFIHVKPVLCVKVHPWW